MFADAKFEVFRPDTVSAFPEFESPEPRRLLNDEPFTMRLVVEAVVNDP